MNINDFILEISLESEEWKPINGFEEFYLISSFGRIVAKSRLVNNGHKDVNKPAHLLKWNETGGTPCIILSKEHKGFKKRIGLLVAEHFLEPPTPDQKVLDYKDGDKYNCCKDNLFWRVTKDKLRKKVFPKIEEIEGEIWKIVPDSEFPNCYAVSNLGRVKSLNRDIQATNRIIHLQEKLLKPRLTKQGYLQVSFGQANTRYIHRLVAITFLENPDNLPQVDHINTIRTDNRLENLHWVTATENMNNELTKQHLSEITTNYFKTKQNLSPIKQFDKEGNFIKEFKNINEILEDSQFTRRGLLDCLKGIYKTHRGFHWEYSQDQILPPV